MDQMKIGELVQKSQWLRKELFEMVMRVKKGHIPSSYSCAEVVLALFYGGILKFDAKNPRGKDRDSLLVSKGHAAMVVYPILADLGFISKDELVKFTKPDGILRMYADQSIPGVEAICGSLGHGFTIAAGLALADKKDGKANRSYVILGDGECYEGSVWETAMFASHYELDNLVAIVDRNALCILDDTEKCVKLNPLEDKWAAFGWHVQKVDGHSYKEILAAFDQIKNKKTSQPSVIIAYSVKGKGISYMENRHDWHNKMPNEEKMAQARRELETNCITG